MAALKAVGIVWLLLGVLALVALIASAPPLSQHNLPAAGGVVTNLAEHDMLHSHQTMLEQMRLSDAPGMATMIQDDPVWADPDMIRLQEEHQSQLDRMIGKRPRP
ncbi:MAG: hypothetical protein BMS9Abin07_1579 [Acidimicrobiia bacterium]|nr:MAG: hypothetical protein BMS9Abin07_1579 [Acidimicrobiia bacterium]